MTTASTTAYTGIASNNGCFCMGVSTWTRHAELHVAALVIEKMGGEQNIGFCHSGKDSVSWVLDVARPGMHEVTGRTATLEDGATLAIACGERTMSAPRPNTGGWDKFRSTVMSPLEIHLTGSIEIKAHAPKPYTWKLLNVAAFELVPVD